MSEIELKACPWCGRAPEVSRSPTGIGNLIMCNAHFDECPATPAVDEGTMESAARAWNTRAAQWQPIESLVSDEPVITWHDFGGINQNTASPHYGKKGYSRIQQRFGGRLFPSEACETGFVSHWQPIPDPPEVEG